MNLRTTWWTPLLAAALMPMLMTTPSVASTLTLSDFSSDSSISASVLDATLDFSLSGNTLTLTVSNLTTDPNAFKINALYFNATNNVTSVTLTSPATGWNLSTSQSADGFGTFSYGLIGGVGVSTAQIDPGSSETFTFTVTGTSLDVSDFVTQLSTNPPGDIQALAAAKFVQGPNGSSAFGATNTPGRGGEGQGVPLPAALPAGMALLGLCGVFRRRLLA